MQAAVDTFNRAEAHGSGPAINIVIPEARDLANAIHRNGMITGAIGAAVLVVLAWTIHELDMAATAASLCAYEVSGLSAIAQANGDKIDFGRVKCGDK